uniref:Uncharacterized protein n=1 Tax=Anguilla anguilla TaxID=7936 RepID=A0A0E9V504_ANGAN
MNYPLCMRTLGSQTQHIDLSITVIHKLCFAWFY